MQKRLHFGKIHFGSKKLVDGGDLPGDGGDLLVLDRREMGKILQTVHRGALESVIFAMYGSKHVKISYHN